MDNSKLKPDSWVICMHAGIVINSVFVLLMVVASEMWLTRVYSSKECDIKDKAYYNFG